MDLPGEVSSPMRIGNYVIRPDKNCWVVATIKTYLAGSQKGEEYESNIVYPAYFDQALRTLPDRQVKDGIEPDTSLVQAVATVAHLYATIGNSAVQNTPLGFYPVFADS